MATKTTVICDIKDCGETAVHKQKMISVIFTTEQTEGRSCDPYLSGEKLDFCGSHYQAVLNLFPLRATGAQGYNNYEIVGDV